MTVMHLRYGTFRGGMLLALLLDDHNREFIQEIQRYEHKHKREGVATGSDDCCKYHQTHNGMTPIAREETAVQQSDSRRNDLWRMPNCDSNQASSGISNTRPMTRMSIVKLPM